MPDVYPEVREPPCAPEVSTYDSQTAYIPGKSDSTIHLAPIPPAATPYDNTAAPYGYFGPGYTDHAVTHQYAQEKAPRRILGCSVLVFILSLIIGLLSVTVVGLATGVGVVTNRANDAQGQLDLVTASAISAVSAVSAATVTKTVVAASATPTGTSAPDKGCSTDPNQVSGTTYTAACT